MIYRWEQSFLYICACIFILSLMNMAILESCLKRPKMVDIKSVPTGYQWHSLPLHYATVNQVKNKEDLDPYNFHLKFGNYSDYSFGEEMGQGSTCYVYSGNKISTGQEVVLKKFENETYRYTVKKEVLFLQSVRGHPNILEMYDIIKDSDNSISIVPTILFNQQVFLKVESKLSSSATFEDLNDLGNRFYLYKMLEVLDFAHSHGVIHGDIKPDNIIVNPKTNLMYIIDWGQGCFYIPGLSKQTQIGTMRYKSPELLMNFEYFDYGTDVFAVGMVMSEWIFRNNFTMVEDQGDDENTDLHLDKFARIFGSQAMREYMQKFQMQGHWVDFDIGEYPMTNLSDFIDEDNRQFCSEEAMDLLNKILVLDHVLNYIIYTIIKQSQRLSAKQALQHSYFDPVRN